MALLKIHPSRLVLLGLAGVAYGAVFTGLASAVMLAGAWWYGAVLWDGPWVLTWPEYLIYPNENPDLIQWLLQISAIPAAVLPLLVILRITQRLYRRRGRVFLARRVGQVRPVERGLSDNYGHTEWRRMADARKLFPGPHPVWGGIAVGEAYRVDQDRTAASVPFDPHDKSPDKRTWGRGGLEKLLIDPCINGSGHSLIFAGSGAFKTTSAVSTALSWIGSSVIMDPSCEMGPMLDNALRRQGKDVFHIGIPSNEQPQATGFNVLQFIDTAHPEAEIYVEAVASWIYDDTAATASVRRHEDAFFGPMGRQLIIACLGHLVWSDPDEVEISLATLAVMLSLPENDMISYLKHIAQTSRCPLARRVAATLSNNAASETFSGVYLNATKGCSWLFVGAYADMVSGGDFEPQSLLTERTTAFLTIPLRTLDVTSAIARVLIGALLNTVYLAEGRTNGKVLFLLDECARLGALKPLATARDTGRKYGVVTHSLWQSVGQLVETWGREGARSFIDSADWIGYASIRAAGAGKDLSQELGTYGVLARSEGDNRGHHKPSGLQFGSTSRGTSANVHEISRQLMTAAELQQDLRADEIVIVPARGLPIRCGRAIYFRRPEFADVADRNRFSQLTEGINV